MRTPDRLRFAIQKSGRLSGPARALLERAGLAFPHGGEQLFCRGESLPVDVLRVRDDDIPGLIADGACDLGIVGRNVLGEYAAGRDRAPQAWRPLGFGACRLAIAIPEAQAWRGPADLAGRRIATSYPRLLRDWLSAAGIDADVRVLAGAVEIAPRLGQADAVCDLVSTGRTLAAQGLREVATVLESEAVLAGPAAPFGDARDTLAADLVARLDSVLRVDASRLLMCRAERTALPGVLRELPDAEPPTITAIEGDDWVAVQALCPQAPSWQQMEAIRRAGARGLLVLPVERMLS